MMVKRIILIIFMLCISRSMQASVTGLGLKTGFSGGPLIGVFGEITLDKQSSLNMAISGFPEIILKVETNYRYTWQQNWAPFLQGGISHWRFFRGRGKGQGITDLHLDLGLTKAISSNLNISGYIGCIILPKFINPLFQEELSGEIGVVPTIGLEITYRLLIE